MKKKLFIVVFALLSSLGMKAQLFAVSTDVLHDVLMAPSVGFELVTGERTTLGLSGYGAYHPWGNQSKFVVMQPEFRYFFSGRPMSREFVGIGAIGALYDVQWAGKHYEGESAGIGLTFGYVLSLTHRLNLDFHAGFGMILYRQKEYFVGDHYETDMLPSGFPNANSRGYALLPTRFGISLSYMLK